MTHRPTELYDEKTEDIAKSTWHLSEWDFSFHFYVGNQDNPEHEIHFEVAELYATGEAFQHKEPLYAMDVIEALESICPVKEIILESGGKLTIIHGHKPGVVFENDENKDFYSNESLKTINFDEFYEAKLLKRHTNHEQPIYLGELRHGEFRN